MATLPKTMFATTISIDKRRTQRAEWAKNGFLIFVCGALLFPLGLMLLMSVKDKEQIVYQFFTIQPPFHFENYLVAFQYIAPLTMNCQMKRKGRTLPQG